MSRGRPPLGPRKRGSRIYAWVTAEERERVQAAAAAAGVSESEWVRMAALKEAK